jgi:hypothetical protein
MGCRGSVDCANAKYYNGTVCADGNPCTWGDICQNKVCVPDPNRATSCSASDQCHNAGTCDVTTGQCSNPAKGDGTTCDDGNACTQTDACQNGTCTGTNPISCAASDQCHLGVCDPTSGACTNPQAPDGTACNDGNGCTQTDTCLSGSCTGGNPKTCGGADGCHNAGTCDPTSGTCGQPTEIDKIGCDVFIQVDGVADMGSGNLIALFGYHSSAQGSFHPTTNKVFLDSGDPLPSPQPVPPAYLLPETHAGSFLVPFTSGHSVSWTVDTQTVTASSASPTFTPTPVGTSGRAVDIGNGVIVTLTPDMDSYTSAPSDPGASQEPELGDAFNGVLTGQLSVGSSGAATYTVPISIPPGTAGMAPNLSLVYSSQGFDGIAGQGWSLSGLSMIYRCPKTRLQDGHAKTVALDSVAVTDDAGDGVCLDGQRLFISAQDSHATTYETEFTDFSSITFGGNNCSYSGSFQVVTKSGEIRSYGRLNARLLLPQAGGTPGPKVAAVWALDGVQDVWGNYYTIHYNNDDMNDAVSTGMRVTSIEYTGNTLESKSPFYTITFGYEDRSDWRNARFVDSMLPMTKRLKSITTPRGIYSLTYVQDASSQDKLMLPSRLQQIDYCSAIGNNPKPCLAPLVFDWDAGGYSWVAAPDYAPPSGVAGAAAKLIDLDGDGRLDFVAAQEGQTFQAWRNTGQVSTTCPEGPLEGPLGDCDPVTGCNDGCDWTNSGGAWQAKSNWTLPVTLGKANGDPLGTVFADIDGDGLPDIITDHDATHNGKPQVYLNRIKSNPSNPGWQTLDGLSGDAIATLLQNLPPPTNGAAFADPSWKTLDLTKDKVVDVDGDGRADIIHFASSCLTVSNIVCYPVNQPLPQHEHALFVLRNTGTQWVFDPAYTLRKMDGSYADQFTIVDLNRDGLPDVTGGVRKLNTGDSSSGTVWKDTTITDDNTLGAVPVGDVDGDGQYDWVARTAVPDYAVAFSSGLGWTGELQQGGTGSIWVGGPYTQSLAVQAKYPPPDPNGALNQYHLGPNWPEAAGSFQVVDLNADGLADIVVNHNIGGRLLVNTGAAWNDYDGFASYSAADSSDFANGHWVPTTEYVDAFAWADWNANDTQHPYPYIDSFVDLDGDGVPDRIQSVPYANYFQSQQRRAWLNKFRPPVIKGFSNGLAQNTSVTYSVISTAAAQSQGVYTDSGASATSDGAIKFRMTPLRVVASVATDNGIGGTSSETYQYYDLRTSIAHGDLGFGKLVETNATSGMIATTTYSQLYPYTGRPLTVIRKHQTHGMVSETDNVFSVKTLSQTPGRSMFVYPSEVQDTTYLPSSVEGATAATASTISDYTYDSYGNPTFVSVTTENETGESYVKTVNTTYGDDGTSQAQDEKRMGKATKVVTTTSKLAPQDGTNPSTIVHTTTFEYGTVQNLDTALPLVKKKVEPGKGVPQGQRI